jgi:hypothetical protein
MCPFCLATAAILAGGATGAGGVAAAITGIVLRKKTRIKFPEPTEAAEVKNGNHSDGGKTPEGGLPQ